MYAFIKDRKEYLERTKGITGNTLEVRARTELQKIHQLMMDCAPRGDNFDGTSREGKGDTLCNRTACQTPNHVHFYNSGTNKMYCLSCAMDIRFANLRDMDLYPDFNKELDKMFLLNGWKA